MRSIAAIVFCLQLTVVIEGFQVDGLGDYKSGFFNIEEGSIPNIECSDKLGVTLFSASPDNDCSNQIAVGGTNEILVKYPNATISPGKYEIRPTEMTTYFLYCETTETSCFGAMTYKIELSNNTENEYLCKMKFTAGAIAPSKDHRPSEVMWRKNGQEMVNKTKSLTDDDFTMDASGNIKIFSVSSALAIDPKSSTNPAEYQCSFVYQEQSLDSDPVQLFGAPDVRISFTLQTDDDMKKENDTLETQYTDGDTVQVKCQVSGFPRPTIQWYRVEDEVEKPLTGMTVQTRNTMDYVISTFTIKDLEDQTHRGKYLCVADNGIEGGVRNASRILHARDRLAPLWPFIGIVVQVIVLAVVIAVGEKFRKKKLAEKHRKKRLSEQQPGTSVSS